MIYNVPAGETDTLSAPITDGAGGAATVTKTGGGTLVLTGDNTYTGATEVQAGTLALASRAATGVDGFVADSASLAVDAGTTFDISATTAPVSVNALQGAGEVVLGSGLLTDVVGASGATGYSGVISGAGGFDLTAASNVPAGAATLELTGANTYIGVTTIGAGAVLQVGSGGATGSLASSEISGPARSCLTRPAPSPSAGPSTARSRSSRSAVARFRSTTR